MTLFVVSVSVMVFFTSTASNRIEKMNSPNRQIIATLTLLGSYCLLLLLAWLLVVSDPLDGYVVLQTTMQVVFAAFIPPGFVLLYDQLSQLEEYYEDPDFSYLWTLLGLAFIAFLYIGFMFASPSSV